MGAAPSIPLVVAAAAAAAGSSALLLPAAGILAAGMAVGAAMNPSGSADGGADIVSSGLTAVSEAAEAVMRYVLTVVSSAYSNAKSFVIDRVVNPVRDAASAAVRSLRAAASAAFAKLQAAAAFVTNKVIALVRYLRGVETADAAAREVDRAAAAGLDEKVLGRASARVAAGVKALPPPPPPASAAAVVVVASAKKTPGARAEGSSVAALAARAARRAAEMVALVKGALAELLGAGVNCKVARSCISGVVAAVGLCFEAITAAAGTEVA